MENFFKKSMMNFQEIGFQLQFHSLKISFEFKNKNKIFIILKMTTTINNLIVGNYITASGNITGSNIQDNANTGMLSVGENCLTGPLNLSYASNCVSVGDLSLNSLSVGTYNVNVGYGGLPLLSSGNFNTSIGQSSLNNLSLGNFNTGVGSNSLNYLTTGNNNSAFGTNSGKNIAPGSNNNTAIGSGAKFLQGSFGVYDLNGNATKLIDDFNVSGPITVDTSGNIYILKITTVTSIVKYSSTYDKATNTPPPVYYQLSSDTTTYQIINISLNPVDSNNIYFTDGLAHNGTGAIFRYRIDIDRVVDTGITDVNGYYTNPSYILFGTGSKYYVTYTLGNAPGAAALNTGAFIGYSPYGVQLFTQIAETNNQGFAQLQYASFDLSYNIWIANYYNNSIDIYTSSGSLYGQYFLPYQPFYVSVDPTGNFYVIPFALTSPGLYKYLAIDNPIVDPTIPVTTSSPSLIYTTVSSPNGMYFTGSSLYVVNLSGGTPVSNTIVLGNTAVTNVITSGVITSPSFSQLSGSTSSGTSIAYDNLNKYTRYNIRYNLTNSSNLTFNNLTFSVTGLPDNFLSTNSVRVEGVAVATSGWTLVPVWSTGGIYGDKNAVYVHINNTTVGTSTSTGYFKLSFIFTKE